MTAYDLIVPWEQQYHAVLKAIVTHGGWKTTRQVDKFTGEPLRTRGIPSSVIYIQPDEFPLLTLRPLGRALRMFIGELLWILSGSDEIRRLHKYGVTYWDGWVTEFMIQRAGLAPGHLGNIYGPQWVGYHGRDGRVYNQIQDLLRKLREEPFDKRMVVWAYHPTDSHTTLPDGKIVSAMPVRTCHGNFALYWDEETNTIDMSCFQLSADVPLGLPSNLAMYKTLLIVLCTLTGRNVGTITYTTHDTHIYNNQVEGVQILLDRDPRPSPTVTFSDQFFEICRLIMEEGVPEPLALDEFNHYRMPWIEWLMREVTVTGYAPHPTIPYELLPVAI